MRVSDLFHVYYGHSLALNKLQPAPEAEGIAFVSRTAKNNGVSQWVHPFPGLSPLPPGLMTVCLRSRNHALATFVQPRHFYTAFHVYVLEPKKEMSLQRKLWYANCIEANRYRYNFGRQANKTLGDLELPDSVPAWVDSAVVPNFAKDPRQPSANELTDLDTAAWGDFALGELFDLSRGRNILKRDMHVGKTPYISAQTGNNGVSARLALEPDYAGGAITVVSNGNGGMGFAYYQPEPFIASGDVSVLVPKDLLSPYSALFICTIIFNERYRWNFGRKWVTTRMRDSVIKLPVGVDNKPDFELMHQYMRTFRLARLIDGDRENDAPGQMELGFI